MNFHFKILLSAVAIAAVAGSPAMAQKHPRHQAAPPAAANEGTLPNGPSNANAFAPDGRLLGSDPDRAVRFQIMRDWGTDYKT